MKYETIKKDGDKFALVPVKDLEDLYEELEDAILAIQARKISEQIKNGEIETFPANFVWKLVDTKKPGQRIKLWREYRGLSKAELGSNANVSGQYISMIESGKRAGEVPVLKKIAKALSCDLDDLV